MKKHFIFILAILSALLLSSCQAGPSKASGPIMKGDGEQRIFDMTDKLKSGESVSVCNEGITFELGGAVYYGGFIYIPYTLYGYKGSEPPGFDIDIDVKSEQTPYYSCEYSFDASRLEGGIFCLVSETADSVNVTINNFTDGTDSVPGEWDFDMKPEKVPSKVLSVTPKESCALDVFDTEFLIKKITLSDFYVRIDCEFSAENELTQEEFTKYITSSDGTGSSGFYDSYVQVLYKDGTVSPKYEYSMAGPTILWEWFVGDGQIDAENVRAIYVGDCEFVVE